MHPSELVCTDVPPSQTKAPCASLLSPQRAATKAVGDNLCFNKKVQSTVVSTAIPGQDASSIRIGDNNDKKIGFFCSFAGYWADEALPNTHFEDTNAQKLVTAEALEIAKNNFEEINIAAGKARGKMFMESFDNAWANGSDTI